MVEWFRHVSDAMYLALCAVFQIDPQSADGLKRFVPAYIENATNTQAPRDINICYYAIAEEQNTDYDYVQLRNRMLINGLHRESSTTVPISVLFTFYGTNADNDAEMFWQRIQQDSDGNSARALLRKQKIVPMGKPSRPVTVFETEGTYHRRRCDVRAGFAYLMTDSYSVGYVDGPPVINIAQNA